MSDAFDQPVNAATRYCAVLGHPVRHSASPAMQNAGMAALGLNWRYLAFDTSPKDLAAAIAGAKAMKFAGLNLTVPHKLLAVELVEALDDSARTWGAVNTIRFEARDHDGGWQPLHHFPEVVPDEVRAQGFNTDAAAIIQSLREDLGMEPDGAKILLLGAGGAGRTAALKLAESGARELFLVNRTAAKARELDEEIQRKYPQVRTRCGFPEGGVDLVLNATSLGLKPEDELPVKPEQFELGRARAAYDMIYRPVETRFLKAAKAAGCRVANGLGMLLYQGAAALEIWSGRPAPVAAMRAALLKHVHGN